MSNAAKEGLNHFILDEWQREVPKPVSIAANEIAEKYGDAVSGILFYGSCLRTGEIEDKILDFYVIVESYSAAYQSQFLAVANKVLPPNVFYHEIQIGDLTVRSKYAILSLADLEKRTSMGCLNVSVWARFCQPCMLLSARNINVKKIIARHVGSAVTTMLGNLLSLKPSVKTSREVWVAAFEETYAAELRSERSGKGLEIYLLDQERYDRLTPVAFAALEAKSGGGVLPKVIWVARRWNGKIVSFLRLLKASMTFDGGIDYLAWKIRRHSGVEIEVTDWMRRHPVIAGIVLFWKLRKKGAFK
tara:strand:+ start:858 stop:1766 length:909 start_codon:yes stop_codon:yes gene_type:complete